MAEIALKHVSMYFNQNRALDDVSFEVQDREFFVVFGPAGAGKTTLLHIIAGIYVPAQGEVLINNKTVQHMEPEDRNIAMVFENYALYPHYTVFENIASPLKSPRYRQPNDVIKEKVTAVAKKLNIDPLLERKPAELSNGQRQRVGLGRALVRDPLAFLMDEPLTHLDAKLRHQMRAELKEMQYNLNTTTIYVTHDYLEAMSLGDRIAVLNHGKIEQIGTPHQVYYYPQTEFVAQAFGEPEINMLTGSLELEDGEIRLRIKEVGQTFLLPDDVSHFLQGQEIDEVRLGIRPTDIKFKKSNESSDFIPASVYSFEPLGAKAILAVKLNRTIIKILTSADENLELNEPIFLQFNLHKALFFEPVSKTFLTRSRRT